MVGEVCRSNSKTCPNLTVRAVILTFRSLLSTFLSHFAAAFSASARKNSTWRFFNSRRFLTNAAFSALEIDLFMGGYRQLSICGVLIILHGREMTFARLCHLAYLPTIKPHVALLEAPSPTTPSSVQDTPWFLRPQ